MYLYLNPCLTRTPTLQSLPFGSLVTIIPAPCRRGTAELHAYRSARNRSGLPDFVTHTPIYPPYRFSIACRTTSVPCTVAGSLASKLLVHFRRRLQQ